MSDDKLEEARSTAVDQLTSLGLSAYAARTFVALVTLGEGAAQDVSEVADVPRTRVYDAATELRDRGLIDVTRSTPKRYWAVSPGTVERHFRQEYTHRVTTLTEALGTLGRSDRVSEQRGVWTVTGGDAVAERVAEFVSEADHEVVYGTGSEPPADEILAELSRASDRGVAVYLDGGPRSAEGGPDYADFDPHTVESSVDWTATPTRHRLVVDRETTLVSVLAETGAESADESRPETAIWASGTSNGLVVVLRALFSQCLDDGSNRKL